MRTVRITPKSDGKGRTFGGVLVALHAGEPLFDGARVGRDLVRPAWAVYACSEGQARPFAANLRVGRTVDVMNLHGRRDFRVEHLRSLEYRIVEQRFPEGTVVTAYLPDLLRADPGMVDPKGVRFILLAPEEWCAAQRLDTAGMVEHAMRCGLAVNTDRERDDVADLTLATRLVPVAPLFASYLDRRTRAPLLPDPRFHLQLLLACLAGNLASLPRRDTYGGRGYGRAWAYGWGEDDAHVRVAVAFAAEHAAVEALLAEQVALYYQKVKHG